jgi:hypothetical protein
MTNATQLVTGNTYPVREQNKMRVHVEIEEAAIASTLISACEGGANYWIAGARVVHVRPRDSGEKAEYARLREAYGALVAAMLAPGYALELVESCDGEVRCKRRVDRAAVLDAVGKLCEFSPRLFGYLLDGGDGDSGDALLQLAAIGEVIYG